MFKGIKKKFTSNRSGRSRCLVSGIRNRAETPPKEPPDKGGGKPTSPRAIHPLDQISPAPYAGRLLERHSRTVPSGKSGSSGDNARATGGYNRRTDSFFVTGGKESYPTSPNICVTGGKIEFIVSSETTESSEASEISSGSSTVRLTSPLSSLKTEPSLSTEETKNKTSIAEDENDSLKMAKETPTGIPIIPDDLKRNLSPISRIPIRTAKEESPERKVEKTNACLWLRKNKAKASFVKRSATMPEREKYEEEILTLRTENKQIKDDLTNLEHEYMKIVKVGKKRDSKSCENLLLQDYIQELEELHPNRESHMRKEENFSQYQVALSMLEKVLQKGEIRRKPKVKATLKTQAKCGKGLLYQMLLDRCSSLQLLNAQLQADSQIQRKQYEKCLDKVASQVVHAIIVQKNQREQCEMLTKQVEELKKENLLLTSVLTTKSNCHSLDSRHLFPTRHTESTSQSLPCTLSKPKVTDCDKRNKPVETTFVSAFYDNQKSASESTALKPSGRTNSLGKDKLFSSASYSSSSSLPNSNAFIARNHPSHHPTVNACWYDIVKSIQSGDKVVLKSTPSIGDLPNSSLGGGGSTVAKMEDQICQRECLFLPRRDIEVSHESSTPSSSVLKQLVPNKFDDAVLPQSSHYSQAIAAISQTDTDKELQVQDSTVCCSFSKPTKISLNEDDDGSKRTLTEQVNLVVVGMEEGVSSETITKDEGYSTMSSDVQSEAKDSAHVCTVSTVEEEKTKSVECEGSPSSGAVNIANVVTSAEEVPRCNEKDLDAGKEGKYDYSDGLRVISDEDDSNSDIIFVPISNEKGRYLRHSFNFPVQSEPYQLSRCFSDSYLANIFVRFPTFGFTENLCRTKLVAPSTVGATDAYQNYLKRAFRRESFKMIGYNYFNGHFSLYRNDNLKKSLVSNYDNLSEIFAPSVSHPRILSPSYSHAEMEDWSLELSGEDITPGGTSCTDSISASSLPQTTPHEADLDEDTQDFLWNGVAHLKGEEMDVPWPCQKHQSKVWDLNIFGNKTSVEMISPKSGCSDQPAMWSSSDQLSCCSDIASKCSTDIENFCDQLCNLPELKRVSFSSSENGDQGSLPSNPKLSDLDSTEENSEALEDFGLETVFTRDFYRLIKFESSKSLAASSRSLAPSEGFLTLEKLKNLESLSDTKTLASMLGFIAEQHKYCLERENMDVNCFSGAVLKQIVDGGSPASASRDTESDDYSQDSLENKSSSLADADGNVLTSSESFSWLDLCSYEPNVAAKNGDLVGVPVRPIRSTSLHLGKVGRYSSGARATLPPPESGCIQPPIAPRISSQGATLPPPRAYFREEEPFPPPPRTESLLQTPVRREFLIQPPARAESLLPPLPTMENPYVEPYHSVPFESPVPVIPPHRTPIPPQRVMSKFQTIQATDSPPVPKRVTSRALPNPPPEIVKPAPRTSSLQYAKVKPRKSNRPRSLLKELTLPNLSGTTPGKRRSSSNMGPFSRNSVTLLREMTKAEDEEIGSSSAITAETTQSVGTGWVRVEPVSELIEPQTSGNMLGPLIDGCSSETDEDLAKQLQQKELLKAVQKNRRKRKASRHNAAGVEPVILAHRCDRDAFSSPIKLRDSSSANKVVCSHQQCVCGNCGPSPVRSRRNGMSIPSPHSSRFVEEEGREERRKPLSFQRYNQLTKNAKTNPFKNPFVDLSLLCSDKRNHSKQVEDCQFDPPNESLTNCENPPNGSSEQGVDRSNLSNVKSVVQKFNRQSLKEDKIPSARSKLILPGKLSHYWEECGSTSPSEGPPSNTFAANSKRSPKIPASNFVHKFSSSSPTTEAPESRRSVQRKSVPCARILRNPKIPKLEMGRMC